ncbi:MULTISPECIES: hypothetical protein [unclassified Sulfitobacter]|nr:MULTISPECIES: hypothetical protein [unclassified Sulfitobacter]
MEQQETLAVLSALVAAKGANDMPLTTQLTTTTALVVSLVAAPLYAQDPNSDTSNTQAQTTQDEAEETSKTSGENAAADKSNSAEAEGGLLVVRVGDEDINRSDVSGAISALPPQLRQQPPELLVPMAVNQLIAKELIYKAALADKLNEDSEVVALMEEARSANEKDAMIQVWLQRELGNRVSGETIEAKYEEIKANSDQEIPPLEAVRAQIEQQLRQEAFADVEEDLRKDVEIVYYGSDGKPQTASSD